MSYQVIVKKSSSDIAREGLPQIGEQIVIPNHPHKFEGDFVTVGIKIKDESGIFGAYIPIPIECVSVVIEQLKKYVPQQPET